MENVNFYLVNELKEPLIKKEWKIKKNERIILKRMDTFVKFTLEIV